MRPVITFIIPTYKRFELLIRCLVSIKEFISTSHEIIVIDDSQDGEGAGVTLPYDVTYIRKSTIDRRGLAANRNIGIHFAKGEFIVFIDDDDFLITDDIQKMIENSDAADLVCANHFEYSNDALKPIKIDGFSLMKMMVMNRLPVGSYAIKKSAIKYLFDEDLRSHEDWDFLLKNMPYLNFKVFDLFPIAIDKSNNLSSSHMAGTREYFWLDYISIYARFPCPELAQARSSMLQLLGVNIPPENLVAEPFINQVKF